MFRSKVHARSGKDVLDDRKRVVLCIAKEAGRLAQLSTPSRDDLARTLLTNLMIGPDGVASKAPLDTGWTEVMQAGDMACGSETGGGWDAIVGRAATVLLSPSRVDEQELWGEEGQLGTVTTDELSTALTRAKLKRQDIVLASAPGSCNDAADVSTCSCTEVVSLSGLTRMRDLLRQQLRELDPASKEAEKAVRLRTYLDEVESAYVDQHPTHPDWRLRHCEYQPKLPTTGKVKARLFPTKSTPKSSVADSGGRPRTLSIQGMPREVRSFILSFGLYDFDIENCQPQTLLQMLTQPSVMRWKVEERPEGVPDDVSASFPTLHRWCNDRQSVIREVADFHSLPLDSQTYAGFRKDAVKGLVIRLIFGGSYRAWREENDALIGKRKRDGSNVIESLEAELRLAIDCVLSCDVFASEARRLVHDRTEKLRQEDARRGVNRSARSLLHKARNGAFSLLLQDLENRMLVAMRRHLRLSQFEVVGLCFDGCMAMRESGAAASKQEVLAVCDGMQRAIREAYVEGCGRAWRKSDRLLPCPFQMTVCEKPMYGLHPLSVNLSA